MGIGAAIFMIAAGAIITFALDLRVGWLDLDAVGWVLMVAGAIGLVITMSMFSRRRREVVTSAPVTERRVVEEPRTRVEYDSDRPL